MPLPMRIGSPDSTGNRTISVGASNPARHSNTPAPRIGKPMPSRRSDTPRSPDAPMSCGKPEDALTARHNWTGSRPRKNCVELYADKAFASDALAADGHVLLFFDLMNAVGDGMSRFHHFLGTLQFRSRAPRH